jgi:hypothetical protein
MYRPRLIRLVVRLSIALGHLLNARVFGSCLASSRCHLSVYMSTCFHSKPPLSRRDIKVLKTAVS